MHTIKYLWLNEVFFLFKFSSIIVSFTKSRFGSLILLHISFLSIYVLYIVYFFCWFFFLGLQILIYIFSFFFSELIINNHNFNLKPEIRNPKWHEISSLAAFRFGSPFFLSLSFSLFPSNSIISRAATQPKHGGRVSSAKLSNRPLEEWRKPNADDEIN